MERSWTLGDDLITSDNLLDGVKFDDLILAVHCSSREVNRASVHAELSEILAGRKQDMMFLLENNMEAIMAAAMKGRE
jgi:hypothetical protein